MVANTESQEMFDIVDADGEPIGEIISRKDAHKWGVLHRVIHIHFYDTEGNIYFQKRSNNRSHFPGMLHFAIGWHISAGDTLATTVTKESLDEVGINISSTDIELIGKFHQEIKHPEYDLYDNEIAYDYAYRFDGDVSKLVFNDGEVDGMQKLSIIELERMNPAEYKENNIVPYEFYPQIFAWIKTKI